MGKKPTYQELEDKLRSMENAFQSYKHTAEPWREARKRFYSLSNRTQDGIYNFNLSIHKYVYTNPSFIKMFGHPCKDIVTTDSAFERIHPEDRHKLQKKIEASMLGQKEGDEAEYRCISSEGGIRWLHDRWIVLRNELGVPTAIEGIVRDVTDMKDIISIKDYLESLLNSCMDAIVVTNEKGGITFANKGAEDLFHLERSDIIGRFIGDIIRNNVEDLQNIYEFLVKQAPVSNYECEAKLLNGATVPLLISSSFLRDGKGKRTGIISYMRDISVRKEAEEHIRMLSQQLIKSQEVERSSIARDLHDHLAQNLYSLNIQLSTFINGIEAPTGESEDHARRILNSLQDIMGDVRKMVFNIHPTSLDTLGLTNTINNLCKNLSQLYDFEIDFKTAGMESLELNFDVNIAIYRLIQEGLNNIAKHARAMKAMVRLVNSFPKIMLRIEDDGQGFDVGSIMETGTRNGCLGIWSMKERVAVLNGRMIIRSREPVGTSILVEMPYTQE